MNRKKGKGCFPCHIWGIEDAVKAKDAFRGTAIRIYGDETELEDGTVLHMNYMWDDGSRRLLRCSQCGGLVIRQRSEFHGGLDDDADYLDWIPVASEEEADLLNILWGPLELEGYPFRLLRANDYRYFWTEAGEPVPYDPEELKEKIREKYSGLKPEQKEMLENLIRKAGNTGG